MKITPLLLGALLSAPLPTLADESDIDIATAEATPLETVVVTADKIPQTLENTLASMIVISRAEIARSQAADLAGLLRFHAGLNIAQTGGPGQTATLFLRGTESNHVLVLIDGVEINPATVGGAPFAQIDPDMIERIEIVKGPRSALYGSEAIGGVINIITRKGSDGINVTAHIGGGSFGTAEAGVGFRYGDADTRAGISVNHDSTEGFPPKVGSDLATGNENTTVNANMAQEFGDSTLAFRHWQAVGTTHYLDFMLSKAGYEFDNRTSALELMSDYSTAWSSSLSLSHSHNEMQELDSPDYSITNRNVLDWQHSINAGDTHLLSGGVYLANEEIEVSSFGSGYEPTLETRAIYLQDDMRWDSQQLELALRYSDHNTFGSHTSWNAAWGLELSEDTRISLAAGSAYRAPDATDLYSAFSGNPALEPETTTSFEAGLRHIVNDAAVFEINI
ncbi:MAG TPA: TonB-dependent receptor, partial [Gammaproteobacteria bacterium]|nr:TonB-dependent receptor [Gammaproteobacteria bacterium]